MAKTVFVQNDDTGDLSATEKNGRVSLLRFSSTGHVGFHLKLVEANGQVTFDKDLPNKVERLKH